MRICQSNLFMQIPTTSLSLNSLRCKVDSDPAAGFHLQFQDISPVPVWNVVSLANSAKYSGLENSTKYSGLQNCAKYSGLKHIAKYSGLEHSAKYFSLERSAKYSGLEHSAKYSSLEESAKYSSLKTLHILFLCRD